MSDLTAPFLPRAEMDLRQSIEHVHLVQAVTDVGTITLEVESGELTYDEGWAPHVQASFRVHIPEDQAVLDALDPRKSVRILVSVGYLYPDRVRDVHRVASLTLRTRTAVRPGNYLDLTAASDECLVQDAGNVGREAEGREHPTLWDLGEALAALMPLALGYAPPFTTTLAATTVLTQPLWWSQWWSMFAAWVDEAGAWLYHDGLTGWRLRDRPATASQSVHVLTIGPTGTITESQSDMSREDWANAVATLYRWSDAAGIASSMIGHAWVASGPHAAYRPDGSPLPGLRRLTYDFATPATQASANAAARALLARRSSAGRRVSATATAAYWLRPGHTVSVQLATGTQERHLVSRVAFSLPAGTMTVITRLPDTATITSGE